MKSFIVNESGVMEIPLRLVVYVIITALIFTIAAIGFSNLGPLITADTMEKQIGDIKVSLNTMQYGASRNLIDPASPAGNLRTFKIVLPEDIEYLSFGVDPDKSSDLIDMKKDTEHGNVIFYKFRTGKKKRVPLAEAVELREGLFDKGRWILNNANGKQYGVVIRGNGKFSITFELVYDPVSKEKYTLVHYTDDLDASINPYEPVILPDSLWVSVTPDSIPADGVTKASVVIQLKDRKGHNAPGEVEVNLTTTFGNLSAKNVSTVNGIAVTEITSDLPGTVMITASSFGLNSGSAHLTIGQYFNNS
jgi:hypothetical protein